LALSAGLAWLMISASAFFRAKMWTRIGLRYSFGNREHPPDFSEFAGRADRASKNMLENMTLFIALVAAVHFAGKGADPRLDLGASVFFWSRLVYWPIYLAGIQVVRTVVWAVSILGMFIIAGAML
jgi:uncharacterized MAPEG superfamily protein